MGTEEDVDDDDRESGVQLEEGREPAWDEAFRKRAATAKDQRGFVSLQLGIPVDELSQRVVIGTWQSRADWEAWHATELFQATRIELDEPAAKTIYEGWYEIMSKSVRSDHGAPPALLRFLGFRELLDKRLLSRSIKDVGQHQNSGAASDLTLAVVASR